MGIPVRRPPVGPAAGRGRARNVPAPRRASNSLGRRGTALLRCGAVQGDDTTVLAARGLVKRFGSVRAVDGIDLTIGAGDRVAVLGPNGAGKTTTLLMLLGVITPDEGTIDILGHALPRHRSRAMAHVGFVAGYLPLPDRVTVGEALELFAGFYGMRGRAADDAVAAGLARFRLEHLADRPCMELSSGQRTLAGIAKSTLHRPQLLVLDEPTASLDPDVADRVRTGLLDLNREEGTALLVTSHNMPEVEQICQRVAFVDAGRVVADGTPAEVAARYGHAGLEGVFLHLARGTGEDVA
jgi:ABC-2 type transport system ATP-binding protein